MSKTQTRRGWKKAEPATWLLLSHGEDAQHAGNEGYKENPAEEYRYDAFVPNSESLDVGDTVVIVGKQWVIGSAQIERIERWEGTHTFHRCPTCRGTSLKLRAGVNPYYCDKCKDRNGFSSPVIETVSCICFRAQYTTSFIKSPDGIASGIVLSCTSGQHSIRKADRDTLTTAVEPLGLTLP